MTTTMRIAAPKRVPMDSMRKTALVAGIFYLITFISIPTLALYSQVKNHPDWILSSSGHTGVLAGGFLELIVALAGIGTAVTLYPVVKRQNEGVALGFVTARVLEACMIFAGVVSLLSLLTLRQDLGGAAGANSSRAGHHRRVARRGLQLDVPARAEPHARHQRTAAGLLDVPLPPRAPHHSRAGTHRSPPAHRLCHHHPVPHRPPDHRARAGLPPGGGLGVLAGRLAGRQGLQALPHHHRDARSRHHTRPPRRHRLTPEHTPNTAGPAKGPAVFGYPDGDHAGRATRPGDGEDRAPW